MAFLVFFRLLPMGTCLFLCIELFRWHSRKRIFCYFKNILGRNCPILWSAFAQDLKESEFCVFFILTIGFFFFGMWRTTNFWWNIGYEIFFYLKLVPVKNFSSLRIALFRWRDRHPILGIFFQTSHCSR